MAPVGNVDHRFYSHRTVVGFSVCVCCGWRGRVAGGVGGGWVTEVTPNFRRAREFDRRGRRSTVAAALSTKSCLWGVACYILWWSNLRRSPWAKKRVWRSVELPTGQKGARLCPTPSGRNCEVKHYKLPSRHALLPIGWVRGTGSPGARSFAGVGR